MIEKIKIKMIIKFENFINESDKILYDKKYFIENRPKHIEFGELWNRAVNIATKDGSEKSDYGAVTAIYNNVEKKKTEERKETRKDWVEVKNPSYWKKMVDDTNMSISQRKFYNSILKSIEDNDNTMSPKQKEELLRLKNGIK